jgi:hypothetical protein
MSQFGERTGAEITGFQTKKKKKLASDFNKMVFGHITAFCL